MVYRILIVTAMIVTNIFATVNFEELKSFEAKFTQKVTNESQKTIEYQGDVFIKNSGKVLWKYRTPIAKNVYVIGNVAIIDEPELEQAIYTSLEKSINIIKLLKDAQKIADDLYKAKLYDVDYFITVKDDKVSSLSYKDELENSISIEFSDIKQNSEISDSIFTFLPPDYYDIIKK